MPNDLTLSNDVIDVVLTPTNPVTLNLSGESVALTLSSPTSTLDLTPATDELLILLAPILRGEKGDQGIQGIPGATATVTGSAIASANIIAGTPVYISRANGQLYPADKPTAVTAQVVGILLQSVALGFIGTYDRAAVTLSDWTAITGSASLLTGQTYFLGSSGTLTTSVPTLGTNTRVGVALSSTTFGINPSIIPILL
jgi:hypothetical protein